MGWADFGHALYLNFSSAAGRLAQTKLLLHQEERADRQIALQEQAQKDTVAYQKANLVLKEWLDTREQMRFEQEQQYKQELFDWEMGETERQNEARIKDTQSKITILREEQKIKDEAEQKKQEQRDSDREGIKQSYIDLGMSEEEASAASIEAVPDAVESQIVKDALRRRDLQRLHPDKTAEEINALYAKLYVPKSQEDLSDSVKYVQELRDIDEMEVDEETKDLLRRGLYQRILGGGGSSALQGKLSAIDAEYADDPVKRRLARDKALGAAPPAPGKADPEAAKLAKMDTFEIGTPNRELLENIAINVPTEAADRDLIRSFGSLLEGSTGPADIDATRKEAVASRAELYLRGNRPEGEAGSKLYEAQDYTLAEMPGLWEDLKVMDEGAFGRIDQAHERIARKAGTSSDYAITRFDSKIKALVNRWIRVESGAAITPDEIDRSRELMPGIGNNWKVNMEILRTIGGMFERSKQREYDLHFGNEWGTAISEINLAEATGMLNEIDTRYPTGTQQVSTIADQLRNNNVTTTEHPTRRIHR